VGGAKDTVYGPGLAGAEAPHLVTFNDCVLVTQPVSASSTLFFGSFIPRASRSDLTELRRPSPRPVRRMPGTLISRRNLVPRMF
jgi:hypothetical protein